MDAKLKESGGGRVLIAKQNAPLLVRAMGLPFLAIGGYIGYYLVVGLVQYALHATLSEWLEGILVMLLMAVFAALFLLPGILVSFGAGVRVVMDRNAVTVTSREGLLPWSKKQVLKFEELKDVSMESEERRSSERSSATGISSTRSTWVLNINLNTSDKKRRTLLGTFLASEREEADQFSQKVADWLNLELVDKS